MDFKRTDVDDYLSFRAEPQAESRNLKTFKFKLKYFIFLKSVISLVNSVKGYTFAMDIEFKFMSIC